MEKGLYKLQSEFLVKKVSEDFENEIGYAFLDDDRSHEKVMARMAFANAVLPYSTTKGLGRFMGKDHSSIVYYRKQHDGNMKYYPIYRIKYLTALGVTKRVAEENDIYPKVLNNGSSHLSSEIEKTRKTILHLQSLLETMQKNLHKELGLYPEL